MLEETIILETPPLYSCYGRIGERVCVPVTGNHARRVWPGALNVWSGEVLLLITDAWVQETHQAFLRMLRAHWRGWHIVLFEDRGSPHTAEDSLEAAQALNIEVRLLPTATPELNARDHLWRHTKGDVLPHRPTRSIDESADAVCQYILDLRPHERLQKAGVFSGNFWLTH
jgi:DDE superfamily endonuclease